MYKWAFPYRGPEDEAGNRWELMCILQDGDSRLLRAYSGYDASVSESDIVTNQNKTQQYRTFEGAAKLRTDERVRGGTQKFPSSYQHEGWPLSEAPRVNACLGSLLSSVLPFLRESKVRFIISSGTLLGATRNGSLIAWDDDIEIRIHQDDWNQLHSAFQNGTIESGGVRIEGVWFDGRALNVTQEAVQVFCVSDATCAGAPGAGGPHIDMVTAVANDYYFHYEQDMFEEPLRECSVQLADGSKQFLVPVPSIEKTKLNLLNRFGNTWREPPQKRSVMNS